MTSESETTFQSILAPQINLHLTKYILAYRDDIEKTLNGDNPYLLMQDLKHFLQTKEQQKAKPKKAFATIGRDVKVMLATLFVMLKDEISRVENKETINEVRITDTEAQLIAASQLPINVAFATQSLLKSKQMKHVADQTLKYNDLCVTKFMQMVISMTNVGDHKSTLVTIEDDSYFLEKMKQMTKITNQTWVGACANLYIVFLKCLAKRICCHIWENHSSVNDKLLRAILRECDAPDELLCVLVAAIPESHPRTKKVAAVATTTTTTTATSATGSTVAPVTPAVVDLTAAVNAVAAK